MVMVRAAQLLEAHAEDLKRSHTLNGEWVVLDPMDAHAKDDYDEQRALAAKLKFMATL